MMRNYKQEREKIINKMMDISENEVDIFDMLFNLMR